MHDEPPGALVRASHPVAAQHAQDDSWAIADRLVESIEQLYLLGDRSAGWETVVSNLLHVFEVGDQGSRDGIGGPRLLKWLTPHLERMLRQQAARDQHDEVEAFQHMLLDRHPFGMALFRVNGELLWANASMRERLHAIDRRHLLKLVALHTPRPARLAQEGLAPGSATLDLVALDVPELGPSCVALLLNPEADAALNPALLRDLYSLTPTESAVANSLAQGRSAEDIAATHGTSLQTVRTQIKAVLGKLEVHRQGEAVARLLRSPAWLAIAARKTVSGGQDALHASTLTVRGQQVGLAQYGPPDGHPVLFMHSWAGSRLQVPPDEAALQRHRVRLVVVDRPGCGLTLGEGLGTTPHAIAHTLNAVVDRLRIDRLDVLGYSLGTIFALACAKELGARVERVHLVSPIAPLKSLSDLQSMLPSGRLMLAMAMKLPSLVSPLVRLWMGQMRRRPELYLDGVIPHLPPSDAAIMRTPSMHAHYTRAFVEAVHQGDDAVVREILLMASDWSALLDVRQPVAIWHGDLDSHVPLTLSRRLAEALPQARLTVVPGAGHYLMYHHWNAIVQSLAANANLHA